MSFFLRQLWKQKPQARGPVSAVQRDIRMNAEWCGIDPGSIVLYLPMWGPGNQIDYSRNNFLSTNNGLEFQNNRTNTSAYYGNGSKPLELNHTIDLANEEDYTIFFKFTLFDGYSSTLNNFIGRHDYDNYLGVLGGDTIRLQDNGNNNYESNYSFDINTEYYFAYKQYGSGHLYANDYEYFINGNSLNRGSGSSQPTPRFRINIIAGGYPTADYAHYGTVDLCSIIQSELKSSQIALLSDHPYILLHRPWVTPPIYVDLGGGTTVTQTTSLDALISKSISKTTSLDALLSTPQSISLSIDAVLASLGSSLASLDGVLSKQLSDTTSLDALLRKTGVTSATALDAILVSTAYGSVSAALDALLQQTGQTGTTSLDALLQQTGQDVTVSIDALLALANITASTSVDALIQKAGLTSAVSLDAILIAAGVSTVGTSIDALLAKEGVSFTCSLDALLTKADTSSLSMDAIIAGSGTLSTAIDAVLRKAVTSQVSLDALITRTGLVSSVSLDAILSTLSLEPAYRRIMYVLPENRTMKIIAYH